MKNKTQSKTYISNSPEETANIARKFAEELRGGEAILLSGDLGAGKTHFTKGVAAGLEIFDEITSPTFAIHNIYCGRLNLNHFDFYRLNPREAEILGLGEFFDDKKSVAVVEWWQNAEQILPDECILIEIIGFSERKITINNVSLRKIK